jgi:ferredoxin
MARITVSNRKGPDGGPAAANAGSAVSLLNALLVAGVNIRHDCGGKALCGTCALRVTEGARGLSPLAPKEADRLAAGGRGEGFRLACQTHAMRDVVVEAVLD